MLVRYRWGTGGAGLVSLQEAALEVFGAEAPELDLAGATDGGVMRHLFEYYGRPHEEEVVERFYEVYVPRLEANLADESFGGRALEGGMAVLEKLEGEGHLLGLLTGNLERGAFAKVERYGMGRFFKLGAYGDDHWDRNELGPIAMARASELLGREVTPSETLIIGDTPKDVACAQACGAGVVAVATGGFAVEDLEKCGADRVVESLVGLEL